MSDHLLSIDDLERADIERILERRRELRRGRRARHQEGARRCAAAPSSTSSTRPRTRTSSSFELAAKRLSADLVNIRSAGSAVDKGESLKDTVATLSAYDPAAIVIRSPVGRRGRSSSRAGPPPRSSTPATASTSTRARRCSTSSRCARASARSRAQDLDRRRRAAQPRRALEHARFTRMGARSRSAARPR